MGVTSSMTRARMVRYMRMLGYEYRGSSDGITFRKHDGTFLVLGTWASCERFVIRHPRIERAKDAMNRHRQLRRGHNTLRSRYTAMSKAGIFDR